MDKDTLFYKKHTIASNSKLIHIDSPIVMGILNVTPDSFYDGGNYINTEQIKERVKKIVEEGATIIDIGAASSRPGAETVSIKEEFTRLSAALDMIRTDYPGIIISVDTFRATIAARCIEAYKVDLINDISGGAMEPEIIDIVASAKLPFILMHMQGTPETMQDRPHYNNVVQEELDFFANRVSKLREKGINDIVIDPGFGFGKTLDNNYQLLSFLDIFQMLELPILVGLSRKSMIYKYLNITPKEALTGTTALNLIALQKGASILRVHDVKEAVQTISIFKKLTEESEKCINLLREI